MENSVIGTKFEVRTKGLTKIYGKHKVIREVNLNIPKNKVYGLLGPNGAGKSTILKMLTGIIQPSAGEIIYQKKHWTRESLQSIGALIESPPLYGNLTARENLTIRQLTLGVSKERIDEVLKIVELPETGRKKIKNFSMGMKQRLGIALALMNQPQLLILDEPTNGLDPLGIQSLRELIRSFPEKGITVIISSHILGEIEQMVDEIGILVQGKLGYQGKLPESTQKLEELFIQTVQTYTTGEEEI